MKSLLSKLKLNQNQTCSLKKLIDDHLRLKTCILLSFCANNVFYLLFTMLFFLEVSLLSSHNLLHKFHNTFWEFLFRLQTKTRSDVHLLILHISFNNRLRYVLKRIWIFLSNFSPSLLSFTWVFRLHEEARAFKII